MAEFPIGRQVLEYKSDVWFLPHIKIEATIESVKWGEDNGEVTCDVEYEAYPDTKQVLTDMSVRAKVLRWLYYHSGIFRRIVKA